MSPLTVIITVLAYFAAMLTISWFSGRKTDNAGFFSGNRQSSWYVVAFAMIGASMSGVTYVSVPGMVGTGGEASLTSFGYMQMVLGFFAGQLVVAFVLIPLFYKLNMVSIYQYLDDRFGVASHKTGAWYFFISKITGAAVRLFLICVAMQLLIFDPLNLPFLLNVIITMGIVLLYTMRGGVKSVIWADTLKTLCMIVSVILCIVFISKELGLNYSSMTQTISESKFSRIFFFDDPKHPQYFFKQFFAGMFTLIAMTGLDQDMMQRSLTCKNHKDAQKNIITSAILQTVVIFMFLSLGALLYIYAAKVGITETGDKIFPAVATSGNLPAIVGILFIIGLVSCGYSAGGSALTALTTSFTVDIIGTEGKSEEKITSIRKKVHLLMAIGMAICIIIFNMSVNTSTIDVVYKLASYTYGPILGMFTFGIITKRKVRDGAVPYIAIIAPILCLILQMNSQKWFNGYTISYELLIINAAITFLGMWIFKGKKSF